MSDPAPSSGPGIAQHCTVVLAVGNKPVAAVEAIAAATPVSARLAVAAQSTNARVSAFTASRGDARAVTARLLSGSTP
jgi:hypothetical protein